MINSETISTAAQLVGTLSNKIPHQRTKTIARTVAEATVIGLEVFNIAKSFKDGRSEMKYFVSLPYHDSATAELLDDMGFGRSENTETRMLEGSTDDYYSEDTESYLMKMYYTSDIIQVESRVWKGIPLTIEKIKPEKNQSTVVHFGVSTTALRTKLLEEIDTVVERVYNHRITQSGNKSSPVFRYSSDGSTGFEQDYLTNCNRPLDTVIVDNGVKNKITQHIRTFLDHEESYQEISMPYHTGILLYGPPGTGKTSLVSALAREFQMPLYILNLRHFNSDSEFNRAVRSIRNKAMVVLEDIDTIAPSRTETVAKSKEGLSLDSVLNFLDGMSTPHGTIMVMTTNDKTKLDSAMIRPGRMDVSAPIEYFTAEMVVEFCERFISTDEEFVAKLNKLSENINDESKMTGAELASVLKETMFLDTEGKQDFMLDFIEERV